LLLAYRKQFSHSFGLEEFFMPRKQRFKPTRKPKPVVTNEVVDDDLLIGHHVSSNHDHAEQRPTSAIREQKLASPGPGQ
jgi:hypothetical protein